jgi:hypothetical protein
MTMQVDDAARRTILGCRFDLTKTSGVIDKSLLATVRFAC